MRVALWIVAFIAGFYVLNAIFQMATGNGDAAGGSIIIAVVAFAVWGFIARAYQQRTHH